MEVLLRRAAVRHLGLACRHSSFHTETHEIRIISFRKATKREAKVYFDAFQN